MKEPLHPFCLPFHGHLHVWVAGGQAGSARALGFNSLSHYSKGVQYSTVDKFILYTTRLHAEQPCPKYSTLL